VNHTRNVRDASHLRSPLWRGAARLLLLGSVAIGASPLSACSSGDDRVERSQALAPALPHNTAPLQSPPSPSANDERTVSPSCSSPNLCGWVVTAGLTTACNSWTRECTEEPPASALRTFRFSAPANKRFSGASYFSPSAKGKCYFRSGTGDHSSQGAGDAFLKQFFDDGSSASLDFAAPYFGDCTPTDITDGDVEATIENIACCPGADRYERRMSRALNLHPCGCAIAPRVRRSPLGSLGPCGDSGAEGPTAGDPVDLETHGLREKLECFSFQGKGSPLRFGLRRRPRTTERFRRLARLFSADRSAIL